MTFSGQKKMLAGQRLSLPGFVLVEDFSAISII